MQQYLQNPVTVQIPISKHLLPNKVVFHVLSASLLNNEAEMNKVLIKAIFYFVSIIFKKKGINHYHNKILLDHAPQNIYVWTLLEYQMEEIEESVEP